MSRRLDITSLVAGALFLAIGVVLLLDRTGHLDLSFGALWPMLTGAAGATLVASGWEDRRRRDRGG